ncbi:hypothetical protein [Aeromicrobium fastidiosum]|uniref:PD-(D/E)XK nuclease superfamily protein n=1 Tax=Aeromicrobium fastidiosum TaxID=52699 RepID=A0A641AJX3_9ACTN|nr:hypothetical protein [Aeromicrobium fastidiosum]KAA1375980.1 hypothetical protein ESP62_010990 [Aeromicrobium fastidiosum]MBP2392159.1 hypothetical protein [Aeromicrobium fastidiosum]
MTDDLRKYGKPVPSVFDLLGRGEVDLTAALAWTLRQSPALLAAFWDRVDAPGSATDAVIDLEVADDQGRTDLEIANEHATVVVEAKKGWLVPGEAQLSKYVPRLKDSPHPLLVSLSDSSAEWAATQLGASIGGIPVRHIPWDAVRTDLRAISKSARGIERHWVTELINYLAGATAMRDPSEQWVYCVVASKGTMGGPRTFRDYVTTERSYFHPFGGRNGWPKRPPTFLAFRWEGRVRQINRVLDSKVVDRLQDEWPDIPTGAHADTESPHIIYRLGQDIPIGEIPTKGVYANARVWALLDQILTQPGLAEAVRSSKNLVRAPTD